MTPSGKKNLQVENTDRDIKKALIELLLVKPYREIQLEELCEKALTSDRTFRRHFTSMDRLLLEVQLEYTAIYLTKIRHLEFPKDLDLMSREFFLFTEEQGRPYEQLTLHGSRNNLQDKVFALAEDQRRDRLWGFQEASDYCREIVVRHVNNAVLDIYCRWALDGKKVSLEDIILLVDQIVVDPVQSWFSCNSLEAK